MLDEMHVNDVPLDASDIRKLENADEIAHFFAKLGYNVDERITIPAASTTYASSQDLKMQIQHHELVTTDPIDGDLRVYLFKVRSVTAKLRHDLARGFLRTNDEKVLLVLTRDYTDIEFVYLERSDLQNTQRKGLNLKITIRPIPLTVNRLNPAPVAMRVLKRFTFTEQDSDYQWEKLRSAYLLAEWSEEYFNNRALFSDYYLKQRLSDARITPEWDEDVRPIGRDVLRHLASARVTYTHASRADIRARLFEPLFTQLGFTFGAPTSGADPAEAPDYLLYAPGDASQPVAAALTYPWNRNLDDVDTSRDNEAPDDIPGALVVSLLEKQVAPWVIVTNGKLWRLYSSTASNKATNYYEVDLEEAVAASDQITALKYWWLLFRREAFTGFLDRLLKHSADYARELGDRLKDRVFVEIFPQFAKGFIADMRAQGVREADIDLDAVFSGTMTFLYRLMFTLYAESLELVPINEVQGYRELSLYNLKHEIADVGGIVVDQAPGLLSKYYKTGSSDLYGRLRALFDVIDRGSENLNMPTYNGGLFSGETPGGRFLAQYAIPDRYLALGLDRLTRDLDTKTAALAFIDFKSLGVRHLGSIYEGLLEFKLKIAGEALAVTKDKGREVYQPAAKLKGKTKTSIVIAVEKDEAYLENDKQERKATGSYYTPDYIVKYIVRHTVGPVLDRKFEALTPRLRDAQRGYRDYARLVAARRASGGDDESPDVYWNSDEMQHLVDDCLNVRVLDPAMGSGHFLVEVVDYVSNRLIDYLNGWSENPVWHFIDRTRQDILEDMERQRVSIDADRLTRVALLKRAVLKRCIYGVDLNLMAVELAKVSLWLDAFTLGAPLSFLDHHLKHGNSLIGAMDLSDVVAVGSKRWEMILDAAADMVSLSKRTDSTVSQVDASKTDYGTARAKLEDVKKYANVPVAAYFVDKLNEYRTSKKFRNLIPQIAQIAYGTRQGDAQHALFERAQAAAEEKRFFHWKLEFPEVFIDLAKRAWDPDGGFDAVVGNPPYVDSENMVKIMPDDRAYIAQTYETASGNWDLYVPFVELAYSKIHSQGQSALIIPNKWVSIDYGTALRNAIRTKMTLIADYSHGRVFDDAGIFPVVVCVHGDSIDSPLKVESFNAESKLVLKQELERKYLQDEKTWGLVFSERFSIFIRLWNTTTKLTEYVDTESAFTVSEAYEVGEFLSDGSPNDKGFRFIVTGAIDRYENLWGTEKTRYLKQDYAFPVFDKKRFEQYSKRRFEQANSEKIIVAGIRYFEALLDKTGDYVAAKSTSIVRNFRNGIKSEMILALLNAHFTSFYFKELYGSLAMDGGITFTHNMISELPMPYISFTTPAGERERLAQTISGAYHGGDSADVLRRVQAALDEQQTDVVHDVLAHLAQRMIDLNKDKQREVKRFLGWLETRLRIQPKKDGSTGLDSLTGKTLIQGYLGDYQKGEGETPWADFLYRLHQNRNRFGVSLSDVEGEIQIEFEKSLQTLIPIKRDLARTDALIDKIVYRLYGLTDAEIELIERPGYEQALAEAKAQVVADQDIDEEQKIDRIAEGILPAAKRYFERVEPHEVEAALDGELPGWRALPPDAPTFLLTGDYNLRALPDHMDFSSSVIPYTKAVEVVLDQRVFAPFKAQFTPQDARNKFLQAYMRGEKDLTLGSHMIILASRDERALRGLAARTVRDVDALAAALNDEDMREVRNRAAHDEVLTRDEARQARAWALRVLGMV